MFRLAFGSGWAGFVGSGAGLDRAPRPDPEEPGADAIAGHVLATGHGRCWVAWSAALWETGGNYLLAGSPDGLDPAWLRPLVRGFLTASAPFGALVEAAFPERSTWARVVYRMDPAVRPAAPPSGSAVRRLGPLDGPAVEALDPDVIWIAKTWGGPTGLAASGYAWGAFDGDRLLSVACSFFVGVRHEDLGVVTEPDARRQGLSTACAAGVCADIRGRSRVPSWTTTMDNPASRQVAVKLGFTQVRADVLHIVST